MPKGMLHTSGKKMVQDVLVVVVVTWPAMCSPRGKNKEGWALVRKLEEPGSLTEPENPSAAANIGQCKPSPIWIV